MCAASPSAADRPVELDHGAVVDRGRDRLRGVRRVDPGQRGHQRLHRDDGVPVARRPGQRPGRQRAAAARVLLGRPVLKRRDREPVGLAHFDARHGEQPPRIGPQLGGSVPPEQVNGAERRPHRQAGGEQQLGHRQPRLGVLEGLDQLLGALRRDALDRAEGVGGDVVRRR